MGREKEAINSAAYDAYVSQLKVAKKGFPRNKDGDANISEIARKCGFGRQVLYTTIKQRLEINLKEIGIEGGVTKKTQDDNPLCQTSCHPLVFT